MRSTRRILYLVSMATFMRSFAQVIYSPSLVTIRDELGTSTAMVGLTLSVYGLILAFAQIAFGPIIDRLESKRILVVSLALFSLVSTAGFFTGGITFLLVVRSLQALGVAAAAGVGIALISDHVAEHERGSAMGVFETFNAAGAAAGPVVGAVLAVLFGWRADFLALGILGLALTSFSLWQLPPQGAHGRHVGVSDMMFILRKPATFGAIVSGFLVFNALYTIHTLVPVLLTERLGQEEGGIGLILTVLPIGAIVGSLVGGRASDRLGSRSILLSGSAGAMLTFAVLTIASIVASIETSLWHVAAVVFSFGLSAGICLPVQAKIMIQNFPALRGTAGALLYSARFLGSTLAPVFTGHLQDRFNLTAGFGSTSLFLTAGFLIVYFTIPSQGRGAQVNRGEDTHWMAKR